MWRFSGLYSVGGLMPGVRSALATLDTVRIYLAGQAAGYLLSIQPPKLPSLDAILPTVSISLASLSLLSPSELVALYTRVGSNLQAIIDKIQGFTASIGAIINTTLALTSGTVEVVIIDTEAGRLSSELNSLVSGRTGAAYAVMVAATSSLATAAMKTVFAS